MTRCVLPCQMEDPPSSENPLCISLISGDKGRLIDALKFHPVKSTHLNGSRPWWN